MRFISEATQPDGHPIVSALGVTRAGGGFNAERVYIQPTPGENTKHTPLPAGRVPILFWPDPDSEPIQAAINWPGLTTGVPIGARIHENVFFPEETNDERTDQEEGREEA